MPGIKNFLWRAFLVIIFISSVLIMVSGCSADPEIIDDDPGVAPVYTVEPVKQQTFCKKHRCEGTFSVISEFDAKSVKCAVQFQVPCMPYNCDKETGLCITECKKNGDCIPGAECNDATKQCVWMGYTCYDAYTVNAPGGRTGSSLIDCTPYRCLAGVCRDTCSTTNDCSPGYDCAGGLCVLKSKN